MATQYTLTTAFVELTETEGTIQNVGIEDVELASDTNLTAGEGIVLHPGEKRSFSGLVYARKMGENGGTINVVDFNAGGKGGVNHVYIPKGSIAFASLPTTLDSTMLGWTYNVSDAFTTDSQFVEGAGISYPAGQNVVVVEPSTGVFKYDCFGGAYILPVASDTVLGGVKSSTLVGGVGVDMAGFMTFNLGVAGETLLGGVKSSTIAGGVGVDSDGFMTINLPTASASVKGGIKIGENFDVDNDVLTLHIANETLIGGVKSSTIDGGVSVDTLGNMKINLPTASNTVKGGMKLGDSFDVDNDVLILNTASDSILGGVKSSSVAGGVSVDSLGGMSVNTPVQTAAALLNWQPSTAYTVGAVVYTNELAITQKLVCVQAGTSGSTLTISSTAEGTLITDGTVKWMIDSFADGDYSAAHNNGIYRGADITAYWDSGLMSANIAAGKFVGIHIGDYIVKTINLPAITYTDKADTEQTQDAQTFTNAKWLVGALDPHIHCGDTETTAHHVLLIPASTLQRNVKMNPTNDTPGAYTGSDMWRVHMPNWANAIKTAFGSGHVLKHRELLANGINTTAPSGAGAGWVGTASSWAWTDVEVNIPNEQMIYGGRAWGSGFDGGDFPRILPLYALKCSCLDDRSWFWLRAVASASRFAVASIRGAAYYDGASSSNGGGGVRPYFLLY